MCKLTWGTTNQLAAVVYFNLGYSSKRSVIELGYFISDAKRYSKQKNFFYGIPPKCFFSFYKIDFVCDSYCITLRKQLQIWRRPFVPTVSGNTLEIYSKCEFPNFFNQPKIFLLNWKSKIFVQIIRNFCTDWTLSNRMKTQSISETYRRVIFFSLKISFCFD